MVQQRQPGAPDDAEHLDGADDGRLTAVVSDVAKATPATASYMRRLVVSFAAECGAGAAAREAIARAVTEAVTNVVLHAYEPGTAGPVHVTADVEDGALEVVVADEGLGFRAGESGGMGLGLAMIAVSTARFRISAREPNGTEIWMRFLLSA
jgi:anti-sigma regulatory factor (Ser/Thr protein kinase)